MTPLEARIRAEIGLNGPISVESYMAACLFDTDFGYYTTREPFGAAGDFTTAPEVSQMFGEMLAAWWVSARQAMKLPGLALAEIGPGRGTLMADMLRTIGKLDDCALPQVHMVEASPRLTKAQKQKLEGECAGITWHTEPQTLPDVPLGIIANELFDAIPAAQYVKTAAGWFERIVVIGMEDQLEFGTGADKLDETILPAGHDAQPEGQIFETAPARTAMLQSLARHIRQKGGFALFIDYGHAQTGFGDTLQAVRSHEHAGVFAYPGEADLTTHVDFTALAHASRREGLFSCEIMSQGDFLKGCGIDARAERLKSAASAEVRDKVDNARRRLTANREMGSLFKVLCLASAPIDLPPLKIRH